MSTKNYYCLVAGLPDLFFTENKQGFSSLSFRNELKSQLSDTDFELVKLLYLPFDNENLITQFFNRNKPFDVLGNFDKEIIENPFLYSNIIPAYFFHFLKWIKDLETSEFNFQIENKLQSLYYEFVLTTKNRFLKEWFSFELNIKNILTAFNCQQFNYSGEVQLIPAHSTSTVHSLLITKRLKPELFVDEVPHAEQIFRIAESNLNIREKEMAIDKILWEYLDEQTFFHFFSIEKILSYAIKLGIIERWMELDSETGKAMLNQLIEELNNSYQFPEEFSITK